MQDHKALLNLISISAKFYTLLKTPRSAIKVRTHSGAYPSGKPPGSDRTWAILCKTSESINPPEPKRLNVELFLKIYDGELRELLSPHCFRGRRFLEDLTQQGYSGGEVRWKGRRRSSTIILVYTQCDFEGLVSTEKRDQELDTGWRLWRGRFWPQVEFRDEDHSYRKFLRLKNFKKRDTFGLDRARVCNLLHYHKLIKTKEWDSCQPRCQILA